MSLRVRLKMLEKRHAPADDGEMKARRDAMLRRLGLDPDTVGFTPAEQSPLRPDETATDYIRRRLDEYETRQ